MRLTMPQAELYIPDGMEESAALARTTHLAVSAHQDDIEIMAYDGILACFGNPDRWFCGVVVTNGAGSPRDDLYASYTDEQMQAVRRVEQKKAAFVGEYGAQFLLDYPSSAVKDGSARGPVEDLKNILSACRPEVVYTHNLADKHDTHVGVALKTIQAIRELPREVQPKKLYGCEVWRDLDWMTDADKVGFDLSAHPNLAAALLGVFDSQICGGKRYDLATTGRRFAHATYFASHGTDKTNQLSFAMDMTPLLEDPSLDPLEFVLGFIRRFQEDVAARVRKVR
ncbi:MAG: PIG-L deacetylase family protein [Fimbriimonadaceae bacterium]